MFYNSWVQFTSSRSTRLMGRKLETGLSDKTVKAACPFYVVSTPEQVKGPTHGVNVQPAVDSRGHDLCNRIAKV